MGVSRYNSEGYYDPTAYEALTKIVQEEKAARYRPLVYICSPYSGDTEGNTEKARRYSRFAADAGTIPIAPHLLFPQFLSEETERELAMLQPFVHRTFNGSDLIHFVRAIRAMYAEYGGLGRFVESRYAATGDMRVVLADFRRVFFSIAHPVRCEKHLACIDRGASCKRLNMYFRWFVRCDGRGVDFGLWRSVPMSALYLPLDLHTGRVGRALGLLGRRQNDWRAVEEITARLRELDPDDPVRYDFALFGAGIDGFAGL